MGEGDKKNPVVDELRRIKPRLGHQPNSQGGIMKGSVGERKWAVTILKEPEWGGLLPFSTLL